ncbi:MAG: DUF1232 domain-containing protein [Caldilineales bacterium]|nr:DUF1232 domain-containing protein [Caldilineales bacterium]
METLRLAWALIRDERITLWLRYGVPALMATYLLLPVDLIPDLIPGLGQLDDLAVLWLGLQYFLRTCPADIVAEHRATLRGESVTTDADAEVVDGVYRVVDE